MQIINVVQGTPEWLKLRAKHRTASEAPAMMGDDPNVSRSDLLRMKATCSEREFSDWFQKNILARGHEIEALARPLAEDIVGSELFPATVTDDNGYLLASLDGMDMDDSVVWECKQWSAESADEVSKGRCPRKHFWQIQQALLITGAERALLTISDGTEVNSVHTWVAADKDAHNKLLAGWRQFETDLAEYQHVEPALQPVATPIDDLPVLSVQIAGSVTASNLVPWREVVVARIAAINTNLKTDQDFADADKMVKFLADGEKRLDLVKSQAQAQVADIDAVFRAIDQIKAEMRAKRLDLDKLVKARKESIRVEIMQEGQQAIADHVASLNAAIGKPYMPAICPDFAGAMRGKKTVASLRSAVADELARVKIEASAMSVRIQTNLNTLRELAADHAFLFADTPQLVLKANDDLVPIIKQRIADHKETESKRLDAEREKIRQEEAAKLAAAQEPVTHASAQSVQAATGDQQHQEAPVATVQGEIADTGARMNLGDINARLYPIALTYECLKELGFDPVCSDRASRLYRSQDFPVICATLIRHIQQVQGGSQIMQESA